ncbi:MAG TPA: GTPase Era [Acidimicrobiales bacterium]
MSDRGDRRPPEPPDAESVRREAGVEPAEPIEVEPVDGDAGDPGPPPGAADEGPAGEPPGDEETVGEPFGGGMAGEVEVAPGGEPFRSGFVTIVGRPNVGKSTLLNRILGQKVSIVSKRPQTTRHRIVGVLNRPDCQVVFVDTPGIHKPRTALGERLNVAAETSIEDVDVVAMVVDATQPLGRGDRWVAARVPRDAVVVVNKIDTARPAQVLQQLADASELDLSEYFPVSARTGEGVPELVEHLISRLPPGPRYYPEDMVTDVPEAFWVAELVREQLLAVAREELPHSIATRVTEWEWPYIRCEIIVERESQKGIVIGKRGEVLKRVGTAVRRQLPEGAYLDLHVKVDKDWQRRPHALDRLGF